MGRRVNLCFLMHWESTNMYVDGERESKQTGWFTKLFLFLSYFCRFTIVMDELESIRHPNVRQSLRVSIKSVRDGCGTRKSGTIAERA